MSFSKQDETAVVKNGDLAAEVLSILDQVKNSKPFGSDGHKTTYRGENQ